MKAIATTTLASFALGVFAADIPKAPVPPSPYLPIIYKFADAMLEHGRDTYGPQKTSLFLSALDRTTVGPLTNYLALPGVHDGHRMVVKDGALANANPQHDQNFLRLLYTLSELSGKPKYRDAADAELRWFLTNSLAKALLPEQQLVSWDTLKDEPLDRQVFVSRQIVRPWLLWDRCFELVPDASQRFALDLSKRITLDLARTETPEDKGFGREEHLTPRHAGFYIRTWAVAYAHTHDKQFLNAIETVLDHFQKKRGSTSAFGGARELKGSIAPLLSMAIDCDAAARLVPRPLAQRLEDAAANEDAGFPGVGHDVRRTTGFVVSANYLSRVIRETRTLPWKGPQDSTTAQVGMMCVSRYENTGDVRYRDLIHAAADVYLDSLPDKDVDVSPMTFGHAISLQVAAWRSTARQAYLDRARELADFAVKHFFDQGPLPRASLKTAHYEAITGADTLALAMVELHLHILAITAVRCPPNTIDR